MIRCIDRFESHEKGRIHVSGIELTDGRESILTLRENVGMVFQRFNQVPHLTVLENPTRGPIRARKISKAEAVACAEQYPERVHIPKQRDKRQENACPPGYT